MSLANVGSAATTWSWHSHQDASLTKPPRLSRSTFYHTRPRPDQRSTTARQWKLMQHTGVMQIVGRSLLWVDLTTVHVLLQCTYSNTQTHPTIVSTSVDILYTIDTIYFQDFPVARYLASAVCSSFSQSRTCGIWKTSWAVLDQICWSSLFSLHILTDKPIILF